MGHMENSKESKSFSREWKLELFSYFFSLWIQISLASKAFRVGLCITWPSGIPAPGIFQGFLTMGIITIISMS